MKKHTFCLLILLACFSNINNAQESLSDEIKLSSTAKIWGFLKYYHPQVASGKFDWDQQLIDLLPKIESAKSKENLSKVCLNWLSELGEMKPCKSCQKKVKSEYFDKNFDLSWIENKDLFSTELSNKLRYIENNRLQKNHYYVEYGSVGEANPINENPFDNIGFPDTDYRLLGLFRYWNFIEYFYPNKYLTNQDWNNVLKEMIPKYLKVETEDDYYLIIKELVAKLDDTHTFVRAKNTQVLNMFPYIINIINNNCVISGFHNKQIAECEGLLLGDILLRIDNKDINKAAKESLRYVSGSNDKGKWLLAYKRLLYLEKNYINLTIKRGLDTIKKRIKLYDSKKIYSNYRSGSRWKMIDKEIGYVDVKTLKSYESINEVMTALKSTKAIIFDLRGYPRMSSFKIPGFLNLERKLYAKYVVPDISYPSKFVWKRNLRTSGKKNKDYYKGKIVILVNNESMSRSESVIMALQIANNTITVGNQMAGADGKNLIFEYLGGYKTSMSSQGVFYPDKTQIQRVGVKIDIEVKPTIEGLKAGRDEVFEKAIKIINSLPYLR